VIEAARRYGVRAVGVELDPERLENAHKNAAAAGVTDRVTFVERDLFEADISEATVVTLYLFPEVNARLLPKLLRELTPGTRIVSHDFGLADWAPEKTVEVPLDRTRRVFLWTVPTRR
jgi:cyclopropane fatty-acyl-phospholipid synthase-like methyltransferase